MAQGDPQDQSAPTSADATTALSVRPQEPQLLAPQALSAQAVARQAEDTRQRVRNAIDGAQEGFDAIQEATREGVTLLQRAAAWRTKLEHTREDAIAVAHRYDRYVSQGPSIAGWARDNPWQVLGVAFCAGLIIGARPFQ